MRRRTANRVVLQMNLAGFFVEPAVPAVFLRRLFPSRLRDGNHRSFGKHVHECRSFDHPDGLAVSNVEDVGCGLLTLQPEKKRGLEDTRFACASPEKGFSDQLVRKKVTVLHNPTFLPLKRG